MIFTPNDTPSSIQFNGSNHTIGYFIKGHMGILPQIPCHQHEIENSFCKFYLKGVCKYGKRCINLHQPILEQSQQSDLFSLSRKKVTKPLESQHSKRIQDKDMKMIFEGNSPSIPVEEEHKMLPSGLLKDLFLDDLFDNATRLNKKEMKKNTHAVPLLPLLNLVNTSNNALDDGRVPLNPVTFRPNTNVINSTLKVSATPFSVSPPPTMLPSRAITTTTVNTKEPSAEFAEQFPAFLAQPRNDKFCAFAMAGKCKFGNMCRNIHGIQCPRCALYCLHPTNIAFNEFHLDNCSGRSNPLSLQMEANNLECCLCKLKVIFKSDPRFGLLNCNHVFCLSCIRAWRSKHMTINGKYTSRSCPLCNITTYFVVPSARWTADLREKNKIVSAYRRSCNTIHCKYFMGGEGECPFGKSCFYSHQLKEQVEGMTFIIEDEQPRIMTMKKQLADFSKIHCNMLQCNTYNTNTNTNANAILFSFHS